MRMSVALLIVLLSLSGCKENGRVPVEQIKLYKADIDKLREKVTACDKNGGIKEIQNYHCVQNRCGPAEIFHCKDGMSKIFYL